MVYATVHHKIIERSSSLTNAAKSTQKLVTSSPKHCGFVASFSRVDISTFMAFLSSLEAETGGGMRRFSARNGVFMRRSHVLQK